MKTFTKIFCSILLIPLFLITLISGSIKFGLLNDKFWISSFQKHNVYQNLQIEIKKYLVNKNAGIFTDLVTDSNIKDFTDKNITHVTKFLNGNSSELSFYIPVKRIPKEMLPKKLGTLNEEMSARELIQKFNISGFDPIIFDQFKITGKIINYVFYISLAVLIFLAVFAHPAMLTFFGILLIVQTFFVSSINFSENKIVELMLTSIFLEISKNWQILGICLIIISLIIIFTQKFVKIKHG